ncbi:hypothetical protein BX616_008097 [Lobosporangium transversale]|uniref:P-loop containing nucleoside triphosphate hydrolase protein n=1 Tax=Lobosporangium transversale TaxID=64571 RepID=A0A1Y2GG75_9FUNG|nr:hypothetical protein BCR41DRAFT_424416 [Lobosporangium transversale]KAF9914536.1 hypothetical protein BX616_008097 [Lobosporangium transversale]ORZ08849.1 hypothetical protein BCR41DRAFT_424416 [Lobosporangium transversale]|eukprot:XP_021878632.1 hypothetical protein BCR41DRAFT_424416 [Lobosporangium transversale]
MSLVPGSIARLCRNEPSTPWMDNDFTPCFHQSVLDAGIPLLFAISSLVIFIGTAIYKQARRNHSGDHSGYLPISGQDDTIAGPEADLDDQEHLNQINPLNSTDSSVHLGQVASGRHISGRDAVKTLASAVSLAVSVVWLISRSNEDKETYLYIAPLISMLVWVYVFTLTVIHLLRPLNPLISLTPHFSAFFIVNLPIAFFRFRTQIIHKTSQIELILASIYFANAIVLVVLALTSSKSARTLVPKPGERVPCPETYASISALAFFSWADPLIALGYKQVLNNEDIWDFRLSDYSSAVIHHFRQSILATRKNHAFIVRLIINFRRRISVQAVWAVAWGVLTFVGPFALERILNFVDNKEISTEWGYIYVFGMFFGMALGTVAQSQMLWHGRRISMQLRSIIVGEVYAKALRRKDRAGQTQKGENHDSDNEDEENEMFTHGAINNMISNDTSEISNASAYLQDLYILPLQIALAITFLYRILGWPALTGVVTMACFIPFNLYLTNKVETIQDELMKATDKRAELMNELLQAIRIIKFFSWERNFYGKVDKARELELYKLRLRFTWWIFGTALWFGTPVVVTITTFFVYTKIAGNTLTSSVAFPALALFNVLRAPMDAFPEMLSQCLRAKVSAARIDRFLDEEEVLVYANANAKPRKNLPTDPIIGFKNATFSYASKADQDAADAAREGGQNVSGHHFELKDLNLEFPVGELSVITGPTGSGKTSLLLSLLGEINPVKGQAFLPRRDSHDINPVTGLTNGIAYVAQQAWLQNNTVRNNILFGTPFDQRRYDQVIEMCALQRDFEILEHGDQTEIGERGITLSGGQKQRIALARAIYSTAGHILLDDCLSAVDAHTAKWLFAKCLMGPLMQGRTRILVTHAVSLTLRGAAHVVVLKNGVVVANGTPNQVLEAGVLGDEIYNEEQIIEDHTTDDRTVAGIEEVEDEIGSHTPVASSSATLTAAGKKRSPNSDDSSTDSTIPIKEKKKLMEDEEKTDGSVSWSVYKLYFGSMGGVPYWIFLLGAFIFMQIFQVAADTWLRFWAGASERQDDNDPYSSASFAIASTPSYATSTSSIATNASSLLMSFACQYRGDHNYFGNNPIRICRQEIFDNRQPMSPMSALSYQTSDSSTEFSTLAYKPSKELGDLNYYLGIYALLSALYIVTIMCRQAVQYKGSLDASRSIHRRLLSQILNSPVRFFDTTPLGRIMNRFTKDIETVDQEVAPIASNLMFDLLGTLTVVIVITYVTPQFLFPAFLISILFVIMATLYLRSSRELKRIESITKSPIFSHFGESLSGVATIRAYGQEKRFQHENLELLDDHNRPFFYLWVCNRWLSIRVDILSALVSFFAGLLIVVNRDNLDPGAAGLSLTYSLTFTDHVLWLVRLYSNNEMNMNSVERVREYMDLPQEPPAIIEGSRPPPGWPNNGEIMVENLVMQYSPDDPPVIRDVSFHVNPREKVGIVGRTGAGKSTLAVAFFRFMEMTSGKITVDGIDISTLGVHDLRSSLTIIPQDPVLFIGTIRTNLDPFNEHDDAALWATLKRVHLVSEDGTAPNTFGNLDSEVHENGNNFSQGQRQLIGLARALLKQSKIIILDEATASVDHETDARIQATIREEFKGSTLLTIAHRLRTIIDFDKVLVMDHGQVVQFDTPWNLIRDEGIFRGMCQRSGEFDLLVEMAVTAEKRANNNRS